MRGSIKRYCSCVDPATGRQYAARCPHLANDKHGRWRYRDRLATTAKPSGRELNRRGFPTRRKAAGFRDQVAELLALAKGDKGALARIGDLIFERSGRGGHLPDVEDVRRRLGLGGSLDRSQTVGEWLDVWLAGKRSLKASTGRSYRQHITHYLRPILGNLPLDRLGADHISDMFDLIGEWNEEILKAKEEGRTPALELDQRQRPKVVGVATQRRIYATLRNALAAAWKARRVDVNVALFVEMPPEHREPPSVWGPDEVGRFLEFHADDRLITLYRLILLHGPRRGEAVGARRAGFDHAARRLRVLRPLLQLGGELVESTPKTKAGERVIYLDQGTADFIKRDLVQRSKERLAWGGAYEDNDLIWCREDGTPYLPEYVSRHFKDLAAAAGLPVIRLHDGRHTAATLGLESGVDIKVMSERLGHSGSSITRDLYTHVRRAVHDQAAEAIVALLPERLRRAGGTG